MKIEELRSRITPLTKKEQYYKSHPNHSDDYIEKHINKDDEKLYDQLKDAIYSLSLDIKSAKVCNQISPVEAEEMKEYYWGLLL